jgi:hypothetical protein
MALTGVAVVLLVLDSLKAEAGMVTWMVSLVVEARLLGLTEGIDDGANGAGSFCSSRATL